MEPLIPHTSAWFEDMLIRSPITAHQSMMMCGLAGTNDACGACGTFAADIEEGVRDWIDVARKITFRLCQDCMDIQQNVNGYRFIPLDEYLNTRGDSRD
jgi:hypothetical protein